MLDDAIKLPFRVTAKVVKAALRRARKAMVPEAPVGAPLPPRPPRPVRAAPAGAPAPAPAPAAAPRVPFSVHYEQTPNPNALKFTCNVAVVPKGSFVFDNAEAAAGNPLGESLFALEGVSTVFATRDFVTITKVNTAHWDALVPQVQAALTAALG